MVLLQVAIKCCLTGYTGIHLQRLQEEDEAIENAPSVETVPVLE